MKCLITRVITNQIAQVFKFYSLIGWYANAVRTLKPYCILSIHITCTKIDWIGMWGEIDPDMEWIGAWDNQVWAWGHWHDWGMGIE